MRKKALGHAVYFCTQLVFSKRGLTTFDFSSNQLGISFKFKFWLNNISIVDSLKNTNNILKEKHYLYEYGYYNCHPNTLNTNYSLLGHLS